MVAVCLVVVRNGFGGSWLFLVGNNNKKVYFNRIESKIKSPVGVKINRELLNSII